MKVIFLDVDGVLVSRISMRKFHSGRRLGPRHVNVLNRIVEKTKAVIVVSSVWRYDGHEKVTARLKGMGVRGKIIGITPRFNKEKVRGLEIQEWLDAYRKQWHLPEDKVESFVILDDDSDMHHLRPRLVQMRFGTGLLAKHIGEIVKLLNTPLKQGVDGRWK